MKIMVQLVCVTRKAGGVLLPFVIYLQMQLSWKNKGLYKEMKMFSQDLPNLEKGLPIQHPKTGQCSTFEKSKKLFTKEHDIFHGALTALSYLLMVYGKRNIPDSLHGMQIHTSLKTKGKIKNIINIFQKDVSD